jgi:hypothetical protein
MHSCAKPLQLPGIMETETRYLGLSVVTRRHRRTGPQGKKIVTRIYTFGATDDPISRAIKDSQVYPGTQTVLLFE